MRWRWLATSVLIAGCSFDRRGLPVGGATDAAVTGGGDARIDARVDAMPDADPCPAGYGGIPGAPSRYRLVTAGKSWLDAEADCEDDGLAHLAILGDDSERDAVRGAIGGQVWLGVTDRVAEGTYFEVTTGVETYLPWLSGEPNNLFNEDCVELNGGGFNDEDCGVSQAYACECDGAAASKNAYTPP
jgi:hypothetical protein